MTSFSALRTRWNSGCMTLLLAGLSLGAVFKLFDVAIRMLSPRLGVLQWSPGTMALVAFAVVLLGPFVIAVLLHYRRHDWKWLSRVFFFWWTGLKAGIVFLLFTLPYLLALAGLKYSTERGLIEADSRLEALLKVVLWALCATVLPFWCLMLVRLLSRTFSGKSLIEPLRQAGIVDTREPMPASME